MGASEESPGEGEVAGALTYSRLVSRALALVAALALIGCSPRAEPQLVAITPSWTPVGQAVEVMVDGANFRRALSVDADKPSSSAVNDLFALTLGDVPLEAVQYLDGARLSARVPATLPAGVYTLTVTDPRLRTATLPDAFVVADPQLARLHIEELPGGAGNELGDVTVRVGQRVPMYAVGRLPNGAFFGNVALASWTVNGVGAMSALTGPASAWMATAPGTATVSAAAPTEGTDLTGTLTALPCAQASDCADRCTANASCTNGRCVYGPSTLDGDGDGFVDALCPGGTDCDDRNPAVKPGGSEGTEGDATCTDNADNDCDGLIDLAEPLCGRNAPPLARLTLTPQAVVQGNPVNGSSTGSSDVEDPATALTYEWDWDGDGVYEAQGATSSKTFGAAGQFRVVLRVTDTRGQAAFATATAYVVASASNLLTVTTGADESDQGATASNPRGSGLSLREAVGIANAGGAQTILVPPGTTVNLDSELHLTGNGGTTIAGAGAVIDGSRINGGNGNGNNGRASCLEISGRLHRIDGLEIRDCRGSPIHARGQDTTVTRCQLHDNGSGVRWEGSNDTFGPDNVVHRNGDWGIDVSGTALVVANVFRDHSGPGIQVGSGGDNSTLTGNMCWDNDRGIELAMRVDNVKVWHNTLHSNRRDGLRIRDGASGADVRNNLASNNGDFGIDASGGGVGTIGGNDLYQNASGGCRACPSLGPRALSVAPGYINSAVRDLRVFRSSPVVNAGLDLGADRNGPAPGNFNGAAPDVGAFEAP